MANKTWSLTSTGDLSVAGNWSPSGVPATTDNVFFPAGSPAITGGLTALNTSTLSGPLGSVVFELGYAAAIATSSSRMQFTCTSFDYDNSNGQAWIDLQASAISPQIHSTASAQTGQGGLSLIGSALVTVNVLGGDVDLAMEPGTTTTAATVSLTKGSLRVGSGVTLTKALLYGGASEIHCAATTVLVYNGKHYTKEAGAIATIKCFGGTIYPESSGTITTAYAFGGTIDFTTSGTARTVTNPQLDPGGVLVFDKVNSVMTFTNAIVFTLPVRLTAAKP